MNVEATALPGVLIVKPRVFGDARGFFKETFHQERYAASGIAGPFVQDNHSRSAKGVLRGLHFQIRHPQGKIVSVSQGRVFDVVADVRPGSPAFGRWHGVELSGENHLQMYIPPGFAHGFLVLSDFADFVYKCTDYYHPEDEGGVLWNDPDLGVVWPVGPDLTPALSAKDLALPRLAGISPDRLPVCAL